MPPSLTPELRKLRARQAAYAKHAKYDATESTAAARAAGPASQTYWEKQVDPDGNLGSSERIRRAIAAKNSYFTGLAYKSARARIAKRDVSP